MRRPIDSPARPHTTPLLAALQLFGFAGSSHLLDQTVSLLPSYETSELARTSTLFHSAHPQEFALQLVRFALVPALVEEIIFRGVLFAIFLRLRGPGFAIILSALLFGVIHQDPHHIAIAALLGLQLGLLRHLHGLPLAIAAHLLNNMLALGTTFLDEAEGHGLPPFDAGAVSLTISFLISGCAWAALAHRLRSSSPIAERSRTDLQAAHQMDE
ncbi:MAG: CPBP family intramembrane metalloprotease [bacterium]|nr:hypothetical protein [Deltaproteobacteria bacterium]MCP4907791.1 CPBP family intramembrane metalloprotease [bacterium]